MTSDKISEFITLGHERIDTKLNTLLESIRDGRPDTYLFHEMEKELKTLIYKEETLLFPKLDSGLKRERNGLELEHGAIWKLLGVIDRALAGKDLDLALRRSESLDRVLKNHYCTEDDRISASIDMALTENSGEADAFRESIMPEGWICAVLKNP